MSKKTEFYDVSPKQKEILEWKHARRMMMREEYLKRINHPTKYAQLGDEGILRFQGLRMSYEDLFVPTVKNFAFAVGVIGTIVVLSKYITWRKEKREHLYRTGQVSYADRQFKFI